MKGYFFSKVWTESVRGRAQKSDSAVSADTTSLLTRRYPTYYALPSGPAHKRHTFKLQQRRRKAASRAGRTLTSEQGQHRSAEAGGGILHWVFVFSFTCMTDTAEPSQRILAMWTDIGKLVLLHLLLLELRVAKGEGCGGEIVYHHVVPGMVTCWMECQRDHQVTKHLEGTCDIAARRSPLFVSSSQVAGGGQWAEANALSCLTGPRRGQRVGMRSQTRLCFYAAPIKWILNTDA